MYKLPVYKKIKERLQEPRRFIQVVMGPRQVGKSTVVKQVLNDLESPYRLFSADAVPSSNTNWILDCWNATRVLAKTQASECILVIDEIQKIENWSEVVKKLWDEDTFNDTNIKVVLLGSSRLLLQKGLSESLAGRFEEIRMAQWRYEEMSDCFGFTLDEYIYYGGYPGSAPLIKDPSRFEEYIRASIVESTLNRDIMSDTFIKKPALLRQTFELASAYSGKILSYTKMLGQIQDKGNVTTLIQYLNLLKEACMVRGLEKYSNDFARLKGSIPKFQVYDSSLKEIYTPYTLTVAKGNLAEWGNIFESAIGAYIVREAFLHNFEVYYWRERNFEVDFVLRKKGILVALEVKSNSIKNTAGLEEFRKRFNPAVSLVVGEGGMPAEDFLRFPLPEIFKMKI